MPTIVWAFEGQNTTLTEAIRQVGTASDEMGTKGAAAWLKLQAANATYAQTLERLDTQMGHYLQVQEGAVQGSARYEQAELRLIALDGQMDAALQRKTNAETAYAQSLIKAADAADAAAAKEAAAAEKAAAQVVAAHEKAQNAFTNMVGNAAENVLVYGSLYSMYGKLTQGVTDFTKALFDNAAANEKFVAFANASVGGGSARLADILGQSTSAAGGGLPLKDLEALDQGLQLLGVTAENSQQRFSRSIGQVRADLITLSSLPGLDSTKALELFKRAEDGANRLALSLQSAGLTTRQELESLGVAFKANSNQIVSTNEQTAEAVLRLIETKWGTLSQVNAQTWDGVTERIRNFATEATGILGKDITGQFERSWGHLLDTVSSPQGVAALQRWGEGLGQFVSTLTKVNEALTDTIFHMYDTQSLITGQPSHLAEAYQAWLKHNDALDAAAAAASAASAAADHHTTALEGEGSAATDTAAALRIYNASLHDVRDTMAQVADVEKAALAPIQAHTQALRDAKSSQDAVFSTAAAQLQDQIAGQQDVVKGIQRQQAATDALAAATTQGLQDQMAAQQDVIKGIQGQQQATDAAATAQVTGLQSHMQALQDQSTALGEKYAALIQPWKDLETQQNRVYENTQRATRLGDLNARIGTDTVLAKDVFSSEGRAAATRLMNEREQQGQLRGEIAHASQIQNDQDHIAALERAQKIAQDGVKAQETATQRQIQGIEAARKASDARYQAAIAGEQTLVDRTQDQLKITERARQTADADYRAAIATEQTLIDQTQDRLKIVETARKAADAFYQAEIAIDATRMKVVQASFQATKDTLTAIEHSLERQIHALQDANKAAQVSAETTSLTVLSTISGAAARVTGTVTSMIAALKSLGISTGPEYHGAGPGPQNPVNGPFLPPGMSNAPGGPQGMAPGGMHVTIGFDDSLRPHVVRVIQNELRQPGNGSNLSAGLSWAGG